MDSRARARRTGPSESEAACRGRATRGGGRGESGADHMTSVTATSTARGGERDAQARPDGTRESRQSLPEKGTF